MVLKFSIDPATGVVKPPVTVFNGGAKKRKTKKRNSLSSKHNKKTRKTIRKKSRKMKGGAASNITPENYKKMSLEEQAEWIKSMTTEQKTIWDTAVTKAKEAMENIPPWAINSTTEMNIQVTIYNEILAKQKKQKNYNALSNEEKTKIDKERELRIKVRQEVDKKLADIPYIYLTKDLEDQIYKNTYNELKKQQ